MEIIILQFQTSANFLKEEVNMGTDIITNTFSNTIIELAKLIKDPVLIILFILNIALIFIIWFILRQSEKRSTTNLSIVNDLSKELHNNSQILVRLATLIQILIGGSSKSKNE